MDIEDKEALARTIASTGCSLAIRDVQCVAFSPAEIASNKVVQAKANEYLLDVLNKSEPGHCIHVTGEMRALADPFHRRLCTELANRLDTRFTVIYDIPESHRSTPEGVAEWNAMSWHSKRWADRLSAMRVIGDALVDVRALKTENEIQYSVFGNLYVLLQEKHADEAKTGRPTAKRTWFLKSARLNEFLTERALRLVHESCDIPEALFKRFTSRVNGLVSRQILNKLLENDRTAPVEKIIDPCLRDFEPDFDQHIGALQTAGFIAVRNECFCLTDDGVQYLRASQ